MVSKHASNLVVHKGSLDKELGYPFKIFKKYVKVFDLYFVATVTSPDEKVLHGATILYHYIDNDDDGIPDNALVYEKLVEVKATMVMFFDQAELDKNESFFDLNEKCMNICVQDLEAQEVFPGSLQPHYFDESLEECFHLVTVGYTKAYPDVFGLKRGSQIADAMDKARGGYFKHVPKKYPEGAWFTYYDKTCGYKCMMTEYIYWAITSMLGAQRFRKEEIYHEWRLGTREDVEKHDPAVFKLLSDPLYKFPTVCPEKIDAIKMFEQPPERQSCCIML